MANSWDSIFQGIGQLGATKARGWDKVIGGSSRLADTFKQIKERKDMFGQQTSEREASQSFQEDQSWLDRNLQQDIAEMDDTTRKQLASEAQGHAEALQNRLMEFQKTELDRQLTHSELMEKKRTTLMLAEFKEAERRFNLTYDQNQGQVDAANQPDFQTALAASLLSFSQTGKYDVISGQWAPDARPLSGSDIDILRNSFNSQFKGGNPPQHMKDAFESYVAGLGGPGGIPDVTVSTHTPQPTGGEIGDPYTEAGGQTLVTIRDGFLALQETPGIGAKTKKEIGKIADGMEQIGNVIGYAPGLMEYYKNLLDQYRGIIDAITGDQSASTH